MKRMATRNSKVILTGLRLLSLAIVFGLSSAWATDIVVTTAVGQQVLADGDTLTVNTGGAVAVADVDANIAAVLSDVSDGVLNDDSEVLTYGITNGTITVNSGGAITATGTGTIDATADTYVWAIQADAAADSTVDISNAGTLSTTASSRDYDAHSTVIQVFPDVDEPNTSDVIIRNLVSGIISASSSSNDAEAHARGVQTCNYKWGLDINNAGRIITYAISNLSDAHSTGIKLGEDNSGTITNSGTIEATAEILDGDYEAMARGIHVGRDDTDTEGNAVNIINAAGGTISAIATSEFAGEAGARAIHGGDGIIGTITNYGTISAAAEGGDSAKAFAVQVEGGLTLDNHSLVKADLTVRDDYDSIYDSRAIGVFAADLEIGDAVIITNHQGASITATATYQVQDYINENAGALAIKLADGYVNDSTSDEDMGISRSVVNAGTLSATSTLYSVSDIDENPGAMGIKAGETYLYNYGANRTLSTTLDVLNSGTINAQTNIISRDSIDDNPGAFGVRAGQTRASNYATGTAAAVASTSIENTGTLTVSSIITSTYDTDDNPGAFGIRVGETYAYDGDAGAESTATATTDIRNSGTIQATTVLVAEDGYLADNSGSFGIRAGNTNKSGYEATATTTIDNSGIIVSTATLTAPELQWSPGAYGIKVGDDNYYEGDGNYNVNVSNSGSITANATLNTDYQDEGENYNRGAFGIRTGAAKVVNTGSIAATATINGLNDSAYDGAYGIRTGEGYATVVHSGAISASLIDNDDSTLQRAVGIMSGQDYNQIHLSGSVAATATGGEAYSIVMGCEDNSGVGNALMIMNGASLSGDVLNAAASGVENRATAVFGLTKNDEGMADFGPYADFLEFGEALDEAETLEDLVAAADGVSADADFDFTFNGDFLGDNEGWNALLMGGTTTINNSELSELAEVLVMPDALLTGNVYLGTLHLLGGVAPGNSVGTLTVAGDFNQAVGSTYYAEVGEGESDLIDVAGTATIEEGAKINVSAGGYVADGAVYTVLSAETLSGFYLDEDLSGGSAVLSYALVDDEDNTVKVEATRTSYSVLGIDTSSAGVGSALADAALAGNADAAAVLALIDNLGTAAEIQAAFGALSPSQYANLIDAGMAGARLYRSTVVGRMGSLHLTNSVGNQQYASNILTPNGPALSRLAGDERMDGSWSAWARVLGMAAEQDSDNNVDGFEIDTVGISFGFDNQVSSNLALGVGFGVNNSDVDFDGDKDTEIDSYNIGLYGTWSNKAFYLDSGLFYANDDYDSKAVRPVVGRSTSSTDGSAWGLYLGGGVNVVDTDSMYFIPTASLEWTQTDVDGFTEKGAVLNYQVDDYDADSLVSTLGFRVGSRMVLGAVKVEPEFRLAWAHEFGDEDRTVKAKFAGGTSTYSFDGVEPEQDSALVGVGVNAYLNDSLSVAVDYDGEFRSDFDGHSIAAMLRYRF